MFHYSGFSLSIHSDFELPGLPAGREDADVFIRSGPISETERTVTMREEYAFNTHAGKFRIRGGKEIIVDSLPGAHPEVLRTLLGGRMMAFLLRQRGWLPLHASGVAVGGSAILFLGPSGSGKSTTAAAFHSRGHQVITDDVGPVRMEGSECVVCPAGSRVRLCGEARAVFRGAEPESTFRWDKYTYELGGRVSDPVSVKHIYLLEYGSGVALKPVLPVSAVASLSVNSFARRRRMDRESMAVHFRDCSSIAAAIPVSRLIRPRSLACLSELVTLVEGNA